jgi:uncharacterized protein YciI
VNSNVSPHVSKPDLFAVIRIRAAAWQSDRPMHEQLAWVEHAAFMNALAASSFIVLGGPLGNGERVLHIVEAESERVIRECLAEDPWEKMSLLRTESVEPWNVLLDRNAQAQPRAG